MQQWEVDVPLFEYKGKTLAGTAVAGELRAKSRSDLERLLRRKKIMISNVNKKPSQLKFRIGSGVPRIEISRFTRQFATMIGAGLPMVQCLDILSKQMESAELRRIIGQVKESVSSGSTLAEGLAKHKKIFDDLFVNMVEAGEVGGALDTILIRLANYREKADALIRKVRGALIYPSVIVVVAVSVTFVMLTWIVPVFAKMFAGLGAELPTPTQVVLAISGFLQRNVGKILMAIVMLWKDEKYEALYEYGTDRNKTAISKEKFVQKMKHGSGGLASSWETLQDVDARIKSPTLVYVTAKIGHRAKHGGTVKFRTETYEMKLEKGIWKTDLSKLMKAR